MPHKNNWQSSFPQGGGGSGWRFKKKFTGEWYEIAYESMATTKCPEIMSITFSAQNELNSRWCQWSNKKAELSQRWPHDAPYISVPWKFSGVPDYMPTANFRKNFKWAFLPSDAKNMCTKFEVHSFTCSWDNRGYPKNWTVYGYAHAPFSPKFLMGLCSYGPHKCSGKFEVRRDIAAFVLQHTTFPHPPLVSPKFPHVPLGVGGWPLGYEEWRRWANCPCN